jgi:CBS domain-containing protein
MPLPWCVLVYGDRGRQEQVRPGIDRCAVVYANPRSDEDERLVREYFHRLSSSARGMFSQLAESPGSGAESKFHDIQCRSLATWENTFSRWTEMTQPAAMVQVVEMFDYRCLYGDRRLADDLDRSIRALLAVNRGFFKTMAVALHDKYPLLSGAPRKTGELLLPDDLSSLQYGVAPLVDIARLFALENRVSETSTSERLRLLGEMPTPIHDQGAELTTAFDVICGSSLHHQYQRMHQGDVLSPLQYIAQLNTLERRILHEAFVAVGKMLRLLHDRFAL